MSEFMIYKGYLGSAQYSVEDEVFYGKLEFIRSLISYEASDSKKLKKKFEKAVDEYLSDCKEDGVEPEKPFKGSFNVRTGSDLHRKIAVYAKKKRMNLNQVIIEALKQYLPA